MAKRGFRFGGIGEGKRTRGCGYTAAGVLGLIFALCGVASAQYGLYVVGTPDTNPEVPAAVEANPYVDGVLLRYTWASLEPAEGQFAWTELDNEVQTAARLGKKVSFAIGAGYFTPAWVYTAGARSFSFVWSGAAGPPPPCTSQQIPVPWDPVYSAKWSAFVSALGQRYDGSSTVSWVHVSGVNSLTDETFLPFAQGGAINVTVKGVPYSCNANNDVQNWIKAGYTRTLAENAWKSADQAFAAAFPHHHLGPMVEPGGFPPIDENGNMIKGQAQDWQVPTDMLANEHQTWGSRFFAQNNGLSAFWSWQLPASLAGEVTVTYQMLSGATSNGTAADPSCRMNGGVSPCDPATVLGEAIDNGIDNGARYLEIYRSDIENPDLQTLLESTQKRLRPSEELRGHIRP